MGVGGKSDGVMKLTVLLRLVPILTILLQQTLTQYSFKIAYDVPYYNSLYMRLLSRIIRRSIPQENRRTDGCVRA
jgi:hypothetical protein